MFFLQKIRVENLSSSSVKVMFIQLIISLKNTCIHQNDLSQWWIDNTGPHQSRTWDTHTGACHPDAPGRSEERSGRLVPQRSSRASLPLGDGGTRDPACPPLSEKPPFFTGAEAAGGAVGNPHDQPFESNMRVPPGKLNSD